MRHFSNHEIGKRSLIVFVFFLLHNKCILDLNFFLFQQPSLKLWGEEETDGAIYTVYLKKVRYHRASVVSVCFVVVSIFNARSFLEKKKFPFKNWFKFYFV